jgi:lipopolysaccharide transport system permease protein
MDFTTELLTREGNRNLTRSTSRRLAIDRYLYALATLVRRDLKARYSRTVLGLGWTVVQPLMLLALYTFVFSEIMKLEFGAGRGTRNFALYLASGMFPFFALSEGILRASTSLTENRSLLDKVRFPAEVLPAVGVVTSTIPEVLGLGLLILFGAFSDVQYSPWLVFLPVLIFLRALLTLGIAWLVSVLNVFLVDIGQFVGLVLTTWMFLTPIFYPAELVPGRFAMALQLNPLHHLVTAYRAVLLEARSPLESFPILIVSTVLTVGIGLAFFTGTVERAKDFL